MAKARGDKKQQSGNITTFDEYQKIVEYTDERKQRVISLMGLVGEVGDLHSMMKKIFIQKNNLTLRNDLREEFGDILWYLTSLAALYQIPLQELAQVNAEKAKSLYSEGGVVHFDKDALPDERLPRKFVVNFYEKPIDRSVHVKISINEIVVGDALTDNSHDNDGYRYHDVFHFAYAAVLGWSPVIRRMLKCKRKSIPKTDEVEDGARAAIIEEAVSILIFNQAEARGWYASSASIDIGLLKIIKRMVSGLEVNRCTAKQWKSAICQGYAAFHELMRNKGGDLIVDLDNQLLQYRQPPRKRKRR